MILFDAAILLPLRDINVTAILKIDDSGPAVLPPGRMASMGGWYFSLGFSLLIIFIGLFTHWTVILAGALLPFITVIGHLRRVRRQRRVPPPGSGSGSPPTDAG